MRIFCDQDTSGSGETLREPGVAAEPLMVVPVAPMRAKLPVAKLLAPISVASLPDREVER